MNGGTDVTLKLHSPKALRGMFGMADPESTIYVAAEGPEQLMCELLRRVAEGATEAVSAN